MWQRDFRVALHGVVFGRRHHFVMVAQVGPREQLVLHVVEQLDSAVRVSDAHQRSIEDTRY